MVKLDKAWWVKNLLTQWKTKEKNLGINLIKNLLIQWETEKENQKIESNVPLIDREHNSGIQLLNGKHSGDMLLIDRKLAELKDDAKYASFPKLTELVKKLFNLTRTGKKKPYCPISHLVCFVKPVEWPHFHFAEGLAGLTDDLAIGGAELRREEVTVGFSGWSLWNLEIIFRKCITAEDGSYVLSSSG